MSALRKTIRWTTEEYMQVARRFFAIRAVSDIFLPEAAELAQQCLPPDRHRPFVVGTKGLIHVVQPKLKELYEPWAMADFDAVKADRVAMAAEIASGAGEFVGPPAAADAPPTPTPTPTPTPDMDSVLAAVREQIEALMPKPEPMRKGPMEAALETLVSDAVQNLVLNAVREEMQRTREEFQSLLSQQYDAIMCYWDPEYKARVELQASYIPDVDGIKPSMLAQVRVRQKRVLISGGQTDQFHNVRMHFKNVLFEFIDGRNPRQVGAGGMYDLVVCTKYTNHSARNTLINLHGNKVVTIDGAMNSLVATVKKYLDL